MPATDTDVVELILADHRRFEQLFAELRDATSDRAARLAELADLLVAHAEAEEEHVYTRLRASDASTTRDVVHGEREHSHGHAALLVLLEQPGTDDDEFSDALEALFEAISHHVNEEELTLLNDARTALGRRERTSIGKRFAASKMRRIAARPGSLDHVREIQDRVGLANLGLAELRHLATARDLPGRTTMSKQQLVQRLAG